MALSRNIHLTQVQTLELRLESFNLLNHVNLGNPNTNLNLGNFGRITALQTGATPRILQFGLKIRVLGRVLDRSLRKERQCAARFKTAESPEVSE